MSYRSKPADVLPLPAEVAEFVEFLREAAPEATVTPEVGAVRAGNWWLECSQGEEHLTVEWRPELGFGVNDPDVEAGYGEGPDEVFRDARLAARRVAQFLKRSDGEAPPSWLRQLREVHGISQVELAERLKVNQAAVSRLENRQDWKVTTLLEVVEAMGGRMQVVAHFKDCDMPVRLPGTHAGGLGVWKGKEGRPGGE
jgi:DNA-binding XRE family transcriptional regulator